MLGHLVYGADVRMVERAGGARFIQQAPAAVELGARMKQLYGDGALQPGVEGAVDDAHATRAEVVLQFVLSKTGSGSQRHQWILC